VIARTEEHTAVREALRLHPGVNWDRLLFSAKECVFKAWFALMVSLTGSTRWAGAWPRSPRRR
jgi:4'-phosphopantetheinyl transferase EntD